MRDADGSSGEARAGSAQLPRLMIKEMVLENFKSYAGEQRVGPFHKCFSSVVGPNGSGKSNVIDAMLFVFGKRAKQLRLNKVSELIHNSTHHSNLEQARVSVHFQEIVDLDDERYEVVPNSEFVISRTAKRDNKSDYFVNDRRSNFTEVTELLKGKGIDLDNNRFLILQARLRACDAAGLSELGLRPARRRGLLRAAAAGGEVEQISMMKPKGQTEHETGLLEYLEDIVGTYKYIAQLEESAKNLEQLNEARQSMVARVKIAERERDGLEGEKDAAEAYLAKERACLGHKSTLAQVFARSAKTNVAKIEANLAQLQEKLEHERAKFAQYEATLKEHEARYNGVNGEHQAIAKKLEQANAEFKEFERKDIKYREDLKHLKAKLRKLEEKLARDGAKAGEHEAEAARLATEVPALQARAEKLGSQLKEAEEGELIEQSGTMSGGGGKPRGGRMCLGSAAPRPAPDARAAAAELAAAEAELGGGVESLAAARGALAEAGAEAKAAERALAELETAIPKAWMEVEAARARAADLEARMGELRAVTEVGAEDAARIDALEADIAREEAAAAGLRKRSEGLAARAAALEAQIEGAGGDALRRQRELVERLQQEIAACEKDATKKGVQAAAAEKAAAKLRKEADKGRAEQEKLAAQQQQARRAGRGRAGALGAGRRWEDGPAMGEFRALEDAAFAMLETVKATQEELGAKEGELVAIRADFEQKQKEVGIIRGVEVDIANEIDQQRASLREEGKNAKHWGRKAEEHARQIAERDGAEPAPLGDEALDAANVEELQYQVTLLEEEMQRMSINLEAIEAYRTKEAEYGARVKELEEATAARDGVRRGHEELRKRRLDEFMAGFNVVSLKLKEMYQMITMGGDAELELVDSLDPFSEGILFSVRPPKKSWKNIANLSGGEKTLSSLSLVFALHHYKPTPLYVMDEIDAALDFKNVSIVGHYIKERTKNAQFVIISLRNNMFELADRLVGIYKTDNATKSVAINPGEFVVGPRQCGPAAGGAADQEQWPANIAAA
eukprot:scaffold14.g1225.t1